MNKCKTCANLVGIECRRFPPIMRPDAGAVTYAFPEVDESWGCAEWKSKRKEKAPA